MKVLQRMTAVIALICTFTPLLAAAQNALVNADYVRVRENPNKSAAQTGFLYKNMVVEIKSQTNEKEINGHDAYVWYEVNGKEVSGWVYGKFLTLDVSDWNVDTYDAPGDVSWLDSRFGESTWYYEQRVDFQSLSLDEYRQLMRAAQGGNQNAWFALRATILKHLKEQPDDLSYAYLKHRLYSEEFLLEIIQSQSARDDRNFFEFVPYSHNVLLKWLEQHGGLVGDMPDEYWKDREIVLQILKGEYGCNPTYLENARRTLASDPEVRSAISACRKRR